MNNREAIRAVIPNAESALKAGAIIKALPHIKPQAIREAIGQMYRDKVLDRTGNKSDGFAYFVCRDVKLKAYATPEERAAGKRRTDADHNRRRVRHRGGMTFEQIRESQAQRRKARIAKNAAKAAAIKLAKAKREAERIAYEQAAAAKRAARAVKRMQRLRTPAQRLLSNAPARPVLSRITEAPKPAKRAETVEEWIAKGNAPQVLPIGAVSQPLKFAGQKGIAKVTWERRMAKAA